MHSDWFTFFSRFWWLMFPLMSLVWGLISQWSSHTRANRILDMVKSYVDQGKEPPAELLQLLQQSSNRRGNGYWHGPYTGQGDWAGPDRSRTNWIWVPIFLFASIAVAFGAMAMWPDRGRGFIFVAIIMLGLCLGNLVAMLTRKNLGDDRTLPK